MVAIKVRACWCRTEELGPRGKERQEKEAMGWALPEASHPIDTLTASKLL